MLPILQQYGESDSEQEEMNHRGNEKDFIIRG